MPVLWISIFGIVAVYNKLDFCGFDYLISIETSGSEANNDLSRTDCRPSGLSEPRYSICSKSNRDPIFLIFQIN